MAKIILVAPSFGHAYKKVSFKRQKFGMPPLGIASIGAFVRSKGHQVRLVDMTYCEGGLEALCALIENDQPDFVGITCSTPQMINASQISTSVKKYFPHITTVVGGPHVSALPVETLEKFETIDIVVVGEGEFTMLEIMEGAPYSSIKGIAYREGAMICINDTRPPIQDLDSLPFPMYEGLPLHYYGHPLTGSTMGMMSGRGCPYDCTFCASNVVHHRGYRVFSAERVVEHIEYLHKELGFKHIALWDDVFLANDERARKICQMLIDKNMDLTWSCSARANMRSKELFTLLKKAGCTLLYLGFESGNDTILKLCNKNITREMIRSFCVDVVAGQIAICAYFILGLPYETKQTLQDTLDFAKSLPIDFPQFAVLMPLPGTKVWEMSHKGEGIRLLTKNWEEFGRYLKPVIELPDVTADELYAVFKSSFKSFYLRPGYIWMRLKKVRSFRDVIWLLSNVRLLFTLS